MAQKKGWISVIVMTVALLLLAAPIVHAQDAEVRYIPVTGVGMSVRLAPNGKTIATFENSVYHDDAVEPDYLPIRLYDFRTGEQKAALTGPTDYASDVAFSPDSTRLASYHANGYLYLWDVATGEQVRIIPALVGQARLKFMPDSATLAVMFGGTTSQILLWDTETGFITSILTPRFPTFAQFRESISQGPPDGMIVFDIAPDGSSIAAATLYSNIWRWDVASSEGETIVKSEDELPMLSIRSLSFSPDSSSLLYTDFRRENSAVRIVDATSGVEQQVIETEARVVAVSPDGEQLAWANGAVVSVAPVDNPDDATEINLTLPEGVQARDPQALLAFTPDGQQLVYGGFVALDTGKNAVAIITLSE